MKRILLLLSFASLSVLTFCCKTPIEDENGKNDNLVPAVASNTWLLHSLADIESYKNEKPSNRMSLLMAKNEVENVQLVITTATNGTLDIERTGNENELAFECRKLEVFEKMTDVLVPCDGRVKPQNKVLKLWLTFRTSKDTAPGKYKEVIRFKTEEDEYAVAISVNVLDVEIPEVPSLPSVFGINPDNFIMTGLNEEQKREKRKEVADLLLDYRATPYFSTWLSGTMKTECFSSPYTWDDFRTWEYLKDARFNRIAFPFHGLSDEELESMLQKVKSEGLMDKAYFYLWDEPTKMAEYEQIHEMADRLHRYAPEAKVITTYYRGPEDGEHVDDLFAVFDILDGATSIFCTGVWSLQGNESRSAMCRKKLKDGQEWWSYVCMADSPGLAQNSSGIANRVVMWRHWKEQTTGFLYWVVNSFGSMSPLKSRSGLPEGDGILVYPGEPFGAKVPCVSIRLERWRDGSEDYELLKMYEAKLGRAEAEKLLSNVYTNPTVYTKNISHVDAMKKVILEALR